MIDTEKNSGNSLSAEKALKRIEGARLTSVQFVLDYLIIGFDEKGALTSLVWPEIIQGDHSSKFGSLEYRNILCGLITETVQIATMRENETIEIHLDNNAKLLIPLRTYLGNGERAILTAPKHFLFVF